MSNQVITTNQTPTLTWAAIANALEYGVQFSSDQRFKTIVNEVTGLGAASVTPAALTNKQKWYWRFRARTSATRNTDKSNPTGAGTGNNMSDVAGDTALAQGFTPANSLPVTRVSLSLKKTGTPAGNITVEIWSSSTGPSAIIGTASAAIAASTLTTSYVTYNFDFSAPLSLVAGTLYYIVLKTSAGIDASNYIVWQTSAGAAAGGNAYKMNGSNVWSTNGTPGQIYTEQTYTWGLWQPMRSIWVDTTLTASFTPAATGWTFVDPADINDNYAFAVSPDWMVDHEHQRKSQVKNIAGDLLTEYVSTRDVIELTFEGGYAQYDQTAELMRFFFKRKSLFLIAVLDYAQDKQERVWKVDFTAAPQITPLAAGREDFFKMKLPLLESALS